MRPIKIEPGLKLDLAVAEVIGLENTYLGMDCVLITSCDWDRMYEIQHSTTEGPIACKKFAPSTDLNAAFAAAEWTKLFQDWFLAKRTKGWYLEVFEGRPMDIAETPTPALAICAAILKLKEFGLPRIKSE